jgi:Co/Zn/Cd efflux system component
MIESKSGASSALHSHVFLGEGHEKNERKTWAVIALCGAMMIAETVGGLLFGSIALVADGLHMSTHAGALLLAALAYSYARKHANDQSFTFGTGKFGDLAGFTSAIILAMIALLIGYESVSRLFAPVPIHFAEAIPIACLGLTVNIASAWLLSGGGHHHGHSHGHAQDRYDHDEAHQIATDAGVIVFEVFEDGVPPRFRLRAETGHALTAPTAFVQTVRPDGTRQVFTMIDEGGYLESVEETPEPHAFTAHVRIGQQDYPVVFERARACARISGPRQQHACRRGPRHGRCRGLGDGDRRLAACAPSRLDVDGPACRHCRRCRHRKLGLRPDPGHGGDPARYEPRPAHGEQSAPGRRERGRPTRRSPSLAFGAGASGRNYFGHYDPSAGDGLLSRPSRPFQVAVTSHCRGFAQILICATRLAGSKGRKRVALEESAAFRKRGLTLRGGRALTLTSEPKGNRQMPNATSSEPQIKRVGRYYKRFKIIDAGDLHDLPWDEREDDINGFFLATCTGPSDG